VWANWSGTVRCRPRRVVRPRDEAGIAAALRDAAADGLGVRVAGSGHSHTPLVATDGVLLDLSEWSGIAGHDAAAGCATLRAGTRLAELGEPLRALGLAMESLGDVDVQALGGALATGTHGTGARLGNLATQVIGLRLLGADGEGVECSQAERPDLFRAAQVGLGALGVVSEVRMRLVPAYRLHERIWREDVEPALERFAERVAAHRHFELFWLPGHDRMELKALDPTDAPPDPLPERRRERIDHSDRVLPSTRETRFVEMEYALPLGEGLAAFRRVRERMRAHHPAVVWPVELRTVAADAIHMSPHHGRASATLSLHQAVGEPFHACFSDAEAILREHGGRPHWGKWHRLGARELRPLYPRWDAFGALRRACDPRGLFLNDYLRELLGGA
jgi:FAD/FMN-containing dehydrogenase